MKYHQRVIALINIILLAIDYGFKFNFKYDKTRMRNWVKSKQESILFTHKENIYIRHNYYYSIIFNKDFLEAIALYIYKTNRVEQLGFNMHKLMTGDESDLQLIKHSLIEKLVEEADPLVFFDTVIKS